MNLDEMTEEELGVLAKHGTDEEKRAVARHPNASLETLLALAIEGFALDVDQNPMFLFYVEDGASTAIRILETVAEQTTKEERLRELTAFSSSDVRRAVAMNPNTPPDSLLQLAKDEVWKVRHDVAYNANTHPGTLLILAKDIVEDVRRRVADNSNTPVAILIELSKDDNFVRVGVAMNANTPPTILATLAENKASTVRRGVAMNKNTPMEILSMLAMDSIGVVRGKAKESLDTLKEVPQ